MVEGGGDCYGIAEGLRMVYFLIYLAYLPIYMQSI
jgi:hypothetical protein